MLMYWVSWVQLLQIGWIVQHPLYLQRNITGIKGIPAFQTAAMRTDSVDVPIRPNYSLATLPDENTAIRYGNHVPVCDMVKHSPSARPIYAAEDEVSIERGLESLFLDDAVGNSVNQEPRGRRATVGVVSGYIDRKSV